MKSKKIPLKLFKSIYSQVPRTCIELIIKTKEGIVLSKRSIKPCKGMWHLPGGTILFGEKITDAIARVAKEETGMKVKVKKMLETIEYFLPDTPRIHVIGIAHLVEPISGKLRGSSQGEEIKFFKSIPKNTIKEQGVFLTTHKLFKK